MEFPLKSPKKFQLRCSFVEFSRNCNMVLDISTSSNLLFGAFVTLQLAHNHLQRMGSDVIRRTPRCFLTLSCTGRCGEQRKHCSDRALCIYNIIATQGPVFHAVCFTFLAHFLLGALILRYIVYSFVMQAHFYIATFSKDKEVIKHEFWNSFFWHHDRVVLALLAIAIIWA